MKSDGVMARRPTSPGDVLHNEFLREHGITQDEFAKATGLTRLTVNQIINGKRSITPATALRLGKATGTDPGFWLRLQWNIDLYDARLDLGDELKKIKTVIRAPNKKDIFLPLAEEQSRSRPSN